MGRTVEPNLSANPNKGGRPARRPDILCGMGVQVDEIGGLHIGLQHSENENFLLARVDSSRDKCNDNRMINTPETATAVTPRFRANPPLDLQILRSAIRDCFDPRLITQSQRIPDDAEPWLLSK